LDDADNLAHPFPPSLQLIALPCLAALDALPMLARPLGFDFDLCMQGFPDEPSRLWESRLLGFPQLGAGKYRFFLDTGKNKYR
jgi:hypothetical protein